LHFGTRNGHSSLDQDYENHGPKTIISHTLTNALYNWKTYLQELTITSLT